jgi:hypothetical protein
LESTRPGVKGNSFISFRKDSKQEAKYGVNKSIEAVEKYGTILKNRRPHLLFSTVQTEVKMEKKPLESDWKIFQKHVSEWRERYLLKKNGEIIGILTDESKTPTERFWEAKKRIKEEAKVLTDCLDGHSRTEMEFYLRLMHRHGLIQDTDLKEFSEALREQVLTRLKASNENE